MSSAPIRLDGTTLEGGGQLLRLALSLSSLTYIPIHVTDIRGKRGPISSPGKDGGLKPAHLAGVTWLAKATGADTQGMEPQSRELTFRPASPKATTAGEDSAEEQGLPNLGSSHNDVWKNIYENGKVLRRESHISVSTPGSILLVLQAILPYLLFGPSAFLCDHDAPVPLRITINGGTNVSNSPSIEYASQVLLPMLGLKLGMPKISTVLHKRGWSTGGIQIGSVSFDVTPIPKGHVLPGFILHHRGDLMRVHVSILAPGAKSRNIIRDHVTVQLLALKPEVEVVFAVDEDSRNDKRWYLLLVAETSGGYRLGRDWLYDRKTKGIRVEETCAELVSQVVKDLKRDLKDCGCVDEYMQDQMVVFQALADGQAVVEAGKQQASLHTRTARWVVEQILGIEFDKSGHCEGVSFCVGEEFERGKDRMAEAAKGIKELDI